MSGEDLRILGTTDAIKQNNNVDPEVAKKAAKEKAALDLINQIAGKKEYKESMSTDELKKELEKDLKALHSKRSRDDRKRGVDSFSPINDDTYKTAMDVLEKQMNTRAELNEAFAQQQVRKIAGMTRHLVGENTGIDIANDKDVRGFVREGLKAEYEAGNLTKEQYETARKYGETKKGTHFFKSVWRGITGGKKESSIVYDTTAQNNNVNTIRYSKKGPQYDAELQKKLDEAGISDNLIYQIGDNLVGTDSVVSYSNRKIQAGEAEFITDELNKYARRNGSTERFTTKEAKEIMKGAGYGIEKKIDAKKVVRDVALPTLGGAAVGIPLCVKQTQNVNLNYGEAGASPIHQEQIIAIAPAVTAALAAGLAALGSIDKQVSRVEDKAIPVQIDSDIKTYEDYVEFVKGSETFPSKQAKAMAMQIAAYFTTDDGTLLKDQLLDAYRTAGGSNRTEKNDKNAADNNRDASVLNHREAIALLTKLQTGELKVEQPQKPQPVVTATPVKEEHYVSLQTEIEETEDPTDCYQVKSGDDWDKVIRNVYNIKNEADVKHIRTEIKKAYYEEHKAELAKKGITSWKGGFFPKVGDDLCLPCTIKGPSGKDYSLNVNAEFNHGKASSDYKGVSYNSTTNPFQNRRTSAFYIVNTHDNDCDKLNGETYAGTDKAKAEETVRRYEQEFGIKRTEYEYVNGKRTK